jgi:hypothetical protein
MAIKRIFDTLSNMLGSNRGNEVAPITAPSAPEDAVVLIGARQTTIGCYVYAHRGLDGSIFYIGKGTGSRAWSTQRDDIWRHFIRTRLGGRYMVEILEDGLNEDEALELESELIAEHGERLVNWINPGRQFDYEALGRFHALRDDTKSFVSATRVLEITHPDEAITRYREALIRVAEYASIETESGLVADIQKEIGRSDFGDVAPLDRLTFLLARQGRYLELITEVDSYFLRFPDSVTPNHAVFKRRTDAQAILSGSKKPRRPSAAPKRKVGAVCDEELAPILQKARKDRAPYDWLLAARLCRKAGDYQREHDLLAEYLSGPRVPGRSWLEVEERLHKVKALLAG